MTQQCLTVHSDWLVFFMVFTFLSFCHLCYDANVVLVFIQFYLYNFLLNDSNKNLPSVTVAF